ncbi:MAG: glycosyltransferase family A protein [Candidatus Andersenbacteria bacterium]
MTSPLVSVVVAAYNSEKFIDEALQSAWNQTYKNFEIIVVNDGSTDATSSVLETWKENIHIVTQENRGIAGARNSGIARARGTLIALLDADDIWMPTKLEEQVRFLAENPDIDVVFTYAQNFIHSDSKKMIDATSTLPVLRGHIPPACLFKTELLARVGVFDESLTIGEFAEWYGRALHANVRMGCVSSLLVKRRIHGQNIGIREKERMHDYVQILYKKLHAK